MGICLFSGCATFVENYKKEMTKINVEQARKKANDPLSSHGASIVNENKDFHIDMIYHDCDYLTRDAHERGKVQLWDEIKLKNELNSIPQGGYIYIHINASTIDMGNTKYWEFVLSSFDGNIIKRIPGKNSIPKYTVGYNATTTWWNIAAMPLDKKPTGKFKVYVINKIENTRSEFSIYPDTGTINELSNP